MTTAFLDAVSRLGFLLEPSHPVILTLVKITLVLLLAWAATALLERASAGSRHLVWLVALGALLVVPAVAAWVPVKLAVLPPPQAAASTEYQGQSPEYRVPSTEDPAGGAEGTLTAPDGASLTAPAGGRTERAAASPALGIAEVLLLVWSIGAVALLLRLAMGAWAVRRVVKNARPLEDPSWQTPLYEIADRLGLDAAPRLLQSDDVKMPFAAGLWSTTIVLPKESEAWSAERRSAVLIHELGHVRRRDLVGHTLSRVACALYWFHPLVWTAARQLRAESERACDDLALVFGARPSDYAEHLLDIVTCVRDHNTPAIALAMAHRREFEGRMLAILNPDLARKGLSRAQTTTTVAALAGVALLVGAAVPVPRAAADTPPPAPLDTGFTGLLPESSGRAIPQVVASPEPAAAPAPAPEGSRTRTETSTETSTATRTSVRTDARSGSATGTASLDLVQGGDRLGALVRALKTDSNAVVRRTAAWGLERFASNDTAESALAEALTTDGDSDVREMAAWALQDCKRGGPGMTAIMRAIRSDKSAMVRRTAVWVAGQVGDPASVDLLGGLLADSSREVRRMAAWAIGQAEPSTAPPALVRALGDADADVRYVVSWALYEIEDPATATALEAAFRKETDHKVQLGMLRALGNMGDAAIPVLEKLITSPDPEVRKVAVTGLAGGNTSGPWPWPWPWPRPQP